AEARLLFTADAMPRRGRTVFLKPVADEAATRLPSLRPLIVGRRTGDPWAMAERHRLAALGLSPTLVRALAPLGEAPVRAHDLSSLRLFGSTGEPWNPDPWRWLFEVPGESRRPIINYSGGTEISGGILMGNPLLPLKPCAFSAPCPGIAADVFDEAGRPVRGPVGALAIKEPGVGMRSGFSRYA